MFQHRAQCAAALTTKAEPLYTRLKGGDRSVEDELLRMTEKGFSLVAVSYKEGLRQPEADQLLDAAKKAQKTMPAADLSKLQSECLVEGNKALADFNDFERFLVTSAAKRRVNKIIESGKRNK